MAKVTAGQKNITILAIESSCDETAAAVLRGDVRADLRRGGRVALRGGAGIHPNFQILSSVVRSQILLHKKSGGVIPEVAARAHVAAMAPVTRETLKRAGVKLAELDHIAVTAGPGLIVSLIVGVEFAKTLAMANKKTMIPVNHMAGHLYSIFGSLRQPFNVKFPLVALLASGGHTMLILMHDYQNFEVLGQTLDDAAGEAFDKVARLLGLPYPGGPEISKLALCGKPSIQFPRPMINSKNYDFSFSGLKTAVLYYMRDQIRGNGKHGAGKRAANKKISVRQKADIAASFQQAVIDTLVAKTLRAAKECKAKTVSLSGGVAANKKLRRDLASAARQHHLQFLVPSLKLCTDNAAMIALAACFRLRGKFKPVYFNKVRANSGWELNVNV